MAKSPPSSPFYWNDYYRDTRVLSPLARGIWMDLLCKLHESGRRGEVSLPLSSWLSWCSCSQELFEVAIQEISMTEVGVILINGGTCPGNVPISPALVPVFVTVKSRRMMREDKARKYERLRKQVQRSPERVPAPVPVSVQDCPPVPSLSSSSSPSDWEPPNPLVKGAGTTATDESDGRRVMKGLSGLSDQLREIFARQFVPQDPVAKGSDT